MTLARVVADNVHAVQRDLLCHRLRWEDLGRAKSPKLSFRHFASFVLGAEPNSALGYAVTEGWTITNELLANLAEQHAGLIKLEARYRRPGVAGDVPPRRDGAPPAKKSASAAEAKAGVMRGGAFDRFDSPADFQAKLAAARAKVKS